MGNNTSIEIEEIEQQLGLGLPSAHRRALLDSEDQIHEACDFLLPSSPHRLLRILEVNNSLKDESRADAWPRFLVAFASNGCGDYFAYDLRNEPPSVVYMDPDYSVQENLSANDRLVYESFETWYAAKSGAGTGGVA